MIAIITFYLSFALIVAMLVIKRAELSSGRKAFFARLAAKNDHVFEKAHRDVRTGISYFNRHTFIALMQLSAAHLLSSLRALYRRLIDLAHRHPHSKKVIDMVNGTNAEVSNGGASFFLKKISKETAVEKTTAGVK